MGKKSRRKKEQREIRAFQKQATPVSKSLIEKVCFEIIRWGTYLALLTPLVVNSDFFFLFVSPKGFYLWAMISLIFTAYLVLLTVNFSRYRPRFTPILTAVVLLMAIFVLASQTGVNPSNSFWSKNERMEGLLAWFYYLGFFIVLSSVFKQKKDWLKIFGVSVGVAVLVSIISFLWMNGDSVLARMAIQGSTLGNSSFFGTYLLFNIFLGIWLFVKSQKMWKIIWASCFVIMILALFPSGARAATLCFMGGLFLLFLFYLIFQTKKSVFKIAGTVVFITTIVIASIFFYLAFQPDSIVHQQLGERFGRSRFVVWNMALQGWQERPWLGWGMENFDVVFARHFDSRLPLPAYGAETWFDRAHNVVLDMGVTSGILGLLIYLSIFAISIYLLVKKHFKTKEFWTSAIFIAFLVAYFIQNLTVFDMPVSYMLFFLVLAFINVYTSTEEQNMVFKKSDSLSQGKKTIIGLVIILMIFPFVEFVVQPARASYFTIRCIRGRGLSFNERIEFCQKAVDTSPLGRYQVRDHWAQFIMGTSQALQAKQNIALNDFQAGFLITVEEKRKSIAEHALCFRSHLTLGRLYLSYPFIDRNFFLEAEEVFTRAIELSPTNQKGYHGLVQVKLHQEDFETAFSLAKKAVELEPRVDRAHFVLVQVAMAKGDIELARKKADEAIKINSAWEPTLERILEQ